MNYHLCIAREVEKFLRIIPEPHAEVDPTPQVATKSTSRFRDGVGDDSMASTTRSSGVDGLDVTRFR